MEAHPADCSEDTAREIHKISEKIALRDLFQSDLFLIKKYRKDESSRHFYNDCKHIFEHDKFVCVRFGRGDGT